LIAVGNGKNLLTHTLRVHVNEWINRPLVVLRKQTKLLTVLMALLLVGLVAVAGCAVLNMSGKHAGSEKFYVGVTYGGSSIQEAKELVDKVKNYTNLFVLLSGTIKNVAAVEEIGEYVIASKLNYVIYMSHNVRYDIWEYNELVKWTIAVKERWGECFVGVYYYDEPGGTMIDGTVDFLENIRYQTEEEEYWSYLSKGCRGEIISYYSYVGKTFAVSNMSTYFPDGKIDVDYYRLYENVSSINSISYYPDRTITILERIWDSQNDFVWKENFYVSENITKYPHVMLSYEEILAQNPIRTHDDAAKIFVNMNKERLENINKP